LDFNFPPEYEILDYLDFFQISSNYDSRAPKIEILAQELKKGIELKIKLNYFL
jgi:hypothetical protein